MKFRASVTVGKFRGISFVLMLVSATMLAISGGMAHLEIEHDHVHVTSEKSIPHDHSHFHAPDEEIKTSKLLHCGAEILHLAGNLVQIGQAAKPLYMLDGNVYLTSLNPLLEPPPPRISL